MCEGCKEIYGDKHEEPPCYECKPKYLEENANAISIFFQVRDQWIMGFDGPIALMHSAVHSQMELRGIKNKEQCFDKVMYLSKYDLKKSREKG